jgi:hypothetical protein
MKIHLQLPKYVSGFPEAIKPIIEFRAPRDISTFERPNTVKKTNPNKK